MPPYYPVYASLLPACRCLCLPTTRVYSGVYASLPSYVCTAVYMLLMVGIPRAVCLPWWVSLGQYASLGVSKRLLCLPGVSKRLLCLPGGYP